MLPAGLWDSEKIMQRHKFSAAFGVGGYAAGPMILVARLHGLPSVIFEPNVEPGFTNRVLAGISTRVAVRFRNHRQTFWRAKPRPPAFRCARSFSPRRATSIANRSRILITGGSRGALPINRAVIDSLDLLLPRKNQLFIVHQTGERDYNAARVAYARREFRCGGSALHREHGGALCPGRPDRLPLGRDHGGRVAAAGRAAIFIPFGAATDAHQTRNAEAMQQAGAAPLAAANRTDASAPDSGNFFASRSAGAPHPNGKMPRAPWLVRTPCEDIVDLIESLVRP